MLREVSSLITTGTYTGHSYLGVSGEDMSYSLAQQNKVNVTYGWRIATITASGPADGKLTIGDIVLAMNGQTIKNNDDLASYLEQHTLPGDNIVLTVIRGTSQISVTVTLGTRPAPSS